MPEFTHNLTDGHSCELWLFAARPFTQPQGAKTHARPGTHP